MRHITFAILSILLFSGLTHAQTATPTATPSSVVLEGIFEGEAMTSPLFNLSSGWGITTVSGRNVLQSNTIGNTVEFYSTGEWVIVERYTATTPTNEFRACYTVALDVAYTCDANISNVSTVDQYQTVALKNSNYPSGLYWRIENMGDVATDTALSIDKLYVMQGNVVVPSLMFVPYPVTQEAPQIADYVEATDELGSPVVLGRVDRSLTGGDIVIIMLLASLLLVMLVLLGVTLWRN